MTHVRRVRIMACVLVAITLMVSLLSGSAFAATANNRRKIVMFNNPPTQDVVDSIVGKGITVLDNLSLINALVVQLPPLVLGIDSGLLFLNTLVPLVVQQISDDLLTLVDPICPTPALSVGEQYPWGQYQIGVDDVHPGLQGSGVRVAILD